jgi:hypothetical protein
MSFTYVQLYNRGAQPAQRGFLPDRRQTTLHPAHHVIPAPDIPDYTAAEGAYHDDSEDENECLSGFHGRILLRAAISVNSQRNPVPEYIIMI